MRFLENLALRARTVLLTSVVLAPAASATWSIVAVDTATGEVVVASATCLSGFALQNAVPIIVVGKGGAASQSIVAGASTKIFMYDGLSQGKAPIAILGDLELNDPQFDGRQFGIVDFTHEPVSFSGPAAQESKPSATGVAGSVRYAIQGNILTGPPVVDLCEQVLLSSAGDLGQRVMAAMEAARSMGGDGRCSCAGQPTSCGAPPEEFEKSAHVGFVYIARPGDTDGECSDPLGCAQGDYYMELVSMGVIADPDPVFELQQQYDAWRAAQIGRPDHVHSTVTLAAPKLVADGVTATVATVRLVDVDGTPLASGGAQVRIEPVNAEDAGLFSAGAVEDLGNGTYRVELTAGQQAGDCELAVRVDDGVREVLLYPYPKLKVEASAPLNVGFDAVSLSAGGAAVPLIVHGSAADAGAPYLVLASAHGTQPGVDFDGTRVPLNDDWLLQLTLRDSNGPMLPGSAGLLDADARGAGFAVLPAAARRAWIGLRLHFAGLIQTGSGVTWSVSEPVLLRLTP